MRDVISELYFNDEFAASRYHRITLAWRGKLRVFTEFEIAQLTGAPDRAKFKFEEIPSGVRILVEHAFFAETMIRTLNFNADGEIEIGNWSLHIDAESMIPKAELAKIHQGNPRLGTHIFARQVAAAERCNVKRIKVLAGADTNNGKQLVGYYVWPKLGFDANLPESMCSELPAALCTATTVQEPHALPGGGAWWQDRKHGCIKYSEIDPRRSQRKHLAQYLSKNGVVI